MSDIIQMVAEKTGISPELARKGFGVLLTGLKKFAPELHAKVSGFIPESGSMEAAYDSAERGAGSGGLLGGIAGAAGKIFGGDAGNAAELLQMFSKAGFSPDQVKQFAPQALEQLKTVVPPEVVDQICERIPGLKEVA